MLTLQDLQSLVDNGRELESCQYGLQVTYNTLIDVYGKLGRWEDALQVLQRMKTQVSMIYDMMQPPEQCCIVATSFASMIHVHAHATMGNAHLLSTSEITVCLKLCCVAPKVSMLQLGGPLQQPLLIAAHSILASAPIAHLAC